MPSICWRRLRRLRLPHVPSSRRSQISSAAMLSWKTRSAARLEICHEYSPLITFLGTLLILGSAWAIDAHKSKTKQR
jgi:hypothetical protein